MGQSTILRCTLLLSLSLAAWAQAPKAEPDVVIFTDGERLSGHLVSATSSSFTFQSDMLGSITADWSKVKELHSSKTFAVIPKGVEFKRNANVSGVPEGTLTVADQKITVTPAGGAPKTVAMAEATNVVDDAAFKKALTRNPSFFEDWTGGLGAGASLANSTQTAESFNAAVNLVRVSPLESWLRRRNRTAFTFSTGFGEIKSPGTATVKTSIYHAGLERDEYFSSAFYGFGQALYDHNFSQGLKLQQTYGGGLGYSAIHKADAGLDFKVGGAFIRQDFNLSANNKNLSAITLEEDYRRKLVRNMLFTEQLIVNPSLNDTKAFTASFNSQLAAPISKKLNVSLGFIDGYLNNPSGIGAKKNSTQLNLSLNYLIR